MDAAGVAKRIVAVASEDNDLRVLVQDRVQHLHGPGSTFNLSPRTVASPAWRYMSEDEDGFAGSVLGSLLQVAPKRVYHTRGIGGSAVAGVVIVVVAGTDAYRDEGIAFDQDILVERIRLVLVKCQQTIFVVGFFAVVVVVVVAHHEEEVINGRDEVLAVAKELHEVLVLAGIAMIGKVANDG